MRLLRISATLAVPILLALPSCGGEPADEPADVVAAEAEAPLSDVPAAQALYDEALEILADDRPAAIALLREAVDLDPDFIEAHATISYQLAWHYQNVDRSDSIKEDALRFAQITQELDPDHEFSFTTMAAYYYRIEKDYDRAMEIYERGTELYPENAHFLRMSAHVARRQGDWDRALEILEHSEEIAPSNDALQAIIENHRYNRRWDEAIAASQEHARRNPESTFGPSYLAWISFYQTGNTGPIRDYQATRPTGLTVNRWTLEMMDRNNDAALAIMDASSTEVFSDQYEMIPRDMYRGIALSVMGDEAGAMEAFQHAKEVMEGMLPELEQDCRVHAALGQIHAVMGNGEEALRAALHAVELMPPEKDAMVGPYNVIALAKVYSTLGDAEAAIEQIDYLLSIPSDMTRAWLGVGQVWDPIRDHPSFQALLEG